MLFVTTAVFHGSLVRGWSGLPGSRGAEWGWVGRAAFYFPTAPGEGPPSLWVAAPQLIWEEPRSLCKNLHLTQSILAPVSP